MNRLLIDLSNLPSGSTYEDRYGGYMSIFRSVFESVVRGQDVVVVNPPFCWIPLIWWLGGETEGGQIFFEHDFVVRQLVNSKTIDRQRILSDRTLLEAITCLRPELVDTLWKSDMEWVVDPTILDALRYQSIRSEFVITNNGSYHRSEVLAYLKKLWAFKSTFQKCILVPCAADKPYPSRLHRAILDFLPDDYHLIVATGVLGLVPQELWAVMPHYDSGLPNEWRLMSIVSDYFRRHTYSKVVVYCDYYNEAIERGLMGISGLERVFVNPVKFYYNYIDLLDSRRLGRLKEVL